MGHIRMVRHSRRQSDPAYVVLTSHEREDTPSPQEMTRICRGVLESRLDTTRAGCEVEMELLAKLESGRSGELYRFFRTNKYRYPQT